MTAIAINPLAVSVAPTAAEFAPLVTRFAPTEHGGGGGITKIVAVVAAVAIPFAAPAIASSIGLSAAIGAATTATVGSVVGSAIVGAGLGAVTAAVTGQPIKTGLIGGAIAGGIAGYFAAPQAASTTSSPLSGPTSAPAGTEIASTGIDPAGATIAGPSQTFDAFGNPVTVGSDAASTLTNATTTPVAGADLGAQLSSTTVTPVGAPVSAPGAVNANYALSTPTPGGVTGLNPNAVGQGLQVPTGAGVGAGAEGVRAAADASFMSKVGSSIVAKVSNPETIANMTLQAGAQLLGQAMAPTPEMPPEQRELLEMRKAELAQLKETNEEAFNQQMTLAREYLTQAGYYDPSYMAAQQANKATIEESQRLREAERQAGLRTGTRGLSAGERQRMAINASRNVQSQFDTGFMRGMSLRDQALARSTPPKGDASYYNALQSLGTDIAAWNDTANERRNKQASNITEFFGGLASTKGNTQSEEDRLNAELGRGLRAGLDVSGRIG